MSFEEYAALARQLAEQRRTGERSAAAESERRRDLHAAADYLHHRLTAQGHRLDQLGQAIGTDLSRPTAPADSSAPAGFAASAGSAAPTGWSASTGPSAPTGPSTVAPGAPTGHSTAAPGTPFAPQGNGFGSGGAAPHTGADLGEGGSAGAAGAAQPGRSGVGAYPELPVGQSQLALPTASAAVPAPRVPEVDPAVEVELARRYADEADRHGQQAELLAQRPALLPTWSPLARAVAVYAACGAAAAVLMLALVLASGVGIVDGFTLGAWMCAGLPALAFFGGYLVLGRWGRPAMVAGTPPRYLPLGFLICFLLVPLAYCGYLLLFRALR
ncbi:hypothetical protein ACFOW4_20095 [Micromonospora sp. GCM10011542]|uniref:hypothetical protein n=1 Tax=Micromonospora sp. GCM10011542 TaxID=3317337 RepID=UPI0036183C11